MSVWRSTWLEPSARPASSHARFIYVYDYGDGWEQWVSVEQVLRRDPVMKLRVCLDRADEIRP